VVPKAAGAGAGAPNPANMPPAVAPKGAAVAGAGAAAGAPKVKPVDAGALVAGAPNAKPVATAGAGAAPKPADVAGAPNVNPTVAGAGAGAVIVDVVVDTPKLKPANPVDAGAAGAPNPKFNAMADSPAMLSLVESLGTESLGEITAKMAQAATASRKDLFRDVLARKTAEMRERQVRGRSKADYCVAAFRIHGV
jgi:hypothetical protein